MLQDIGNEIFKKLLLTLKSLRVFEHSSCIGKREEDTSTFKDEMIFHEKNITQYKSIKRRPMVEGKITKMIPNGFLLCS